MLKKYLMTAVYAMCLCAFVLTHTACPQSTNPGPETAKKLPGSPITDTTDTDTEEPDDTGEGKEDEQDAALLTVRINRETETGGILFPEDVPFSQFTLNAIYTDGSVFPEQIVFPGQDPGGDFIQIVVISGEWALTVTGFIDPERSGFPVAVARGTAKVTVQSG
jgi:hypothetical protein